MSKVNFSSMKLKMNNSNTSFDFNGNTIEINDYISVQDKYDLVMITLQKSLENNYYNPIKLDMYFHLNLIYMYTNISFTDKQREDEVKLYDLLKSNGFIDLFLENFSHKEYNELFNWIVEIAEESTKDNRSTVSLIKTLINDLPKQAEAALDIVSNFDKEKYQEVINFAKAANGGREI